MVTTSKRVKRLRQCLKNGVLQLTSNDGVFHFETMTDAGWVFITSVGSENLYFNFTDDLGVIHAGYCKCL